MNQLTVLDVYTRMISPKTDDTTMRRMAHALGMHESTNQNLSDVRLYIERTIEGRSGSEVILNETEYSWGGSEFTPASKEEPIAEPIRASRSRTTRLDLTKASIVDVLQNLDDETMEENEIRQLAETLGIDSNTSMHQVIAEIERSLEEYPDTEVIFRLQIDSESNIADVQLGPNVKKATGGLLGLMEASLASDLPQSRPHVQISPTPPARTGVPLSATPFSIVVEPTELTVGKTQTVSVSSPDVNLRDAAFRLGGRALATTFARGKLQAQVPDDLVKDARLLVAYAVLPDGSRSREVDVYVKYDMSLRNHPLGRRNQDAAQSGAARTAGGLTMPGATGTRPGGGTAGRMPTHAPQGAQQAPARPPAAARQPFVPINPEPWTRHPLTVDEKPVILQTWPDAALKGMGFNLKVRVQTDNGLVDPSWQLKVGTFSKDVINPLTQGDMMLGLVPASLTRTGSRLAVHVVNADGVSSEPAYVLLTEPVAVDEPPAPAPALAEPARVETHEEPKAKTAFVYSKGSQFWNLALDILFAAWFWHTWRMDETLLYLILAVATFAAAWYVITEKTAHPSRMYVYTVVAGGIFLGLVNLIGLGSILFNIAALALVADAVFVLFFNEAKK